LDVVGHILVQDKARLYVYLLSDPAHDECFGGVLSQFLLDELLGYDDVILYSLKQLADNLPSKGAFLSCLFQ